MTVFYKAIFAALILAVLPLNSFAVSSDKQTESPEWRYTVKPGDTLIGFSERYLKEPAKWSDLHKLNRLINPNKLRPGQVLRIPLALLKQTPAPAILVSSFGKVTISELNSQTRPAKAGESLGAGVSIETAENSSAVLKFADETRLNLQPNSRILLDTMSVYEGGGMVDTQLRLQQGRAEIQANPNHQMGNRMQVVTPSAVAAVRGTQFRVSAESDIAREETLEGIVALSAAEQEVSLPAGYGSVAKLGQAPSPPVELLLAPDLNALPSIVERLPMRFELKPQAGAQAWLGQISLTDNFEQVLYEKTANTTRLVFGDLPDGHYFLRVRAQDASSLQGKDAIHQFELNARPFSPLLLAPTQKGVVRTPKPEIRWSEAESVDEYHVELAPDATFSNKIVNENSRKTSMQVPQALTAGDYYLRIASLVGADQGPFSDVIQFTYKPTPAAPDASQTSLSFDDKTMRINLPKPEDGLRYEVVLNADKAKTQTLWKGESVDGKLELPRPYSGKRYLSLRLIEADGTASPYATQAIEVPDKAPWVNCLCSTF